MSAFRIVMFSFFLICIIAWLVVNVILIATYYLSKNQDNTPFWQVYWEIYNYSDLLTWKLTVTFMYPLLLVLALLSYIREKFSKTNKEP